MVSLRQCLLVWCLPILAVSAQEALDFNKDIRPILSDKCFFCHGPDSHERKADLRLDTEAGARADLGGYSAIVPGNAVESEFYQRLISGDPNDLMPPEESHKHLELEEIALLKRWIDEGAVYEEPWAYAAPKKNPVPKVNDANWPANWVDHFVLSKLERKKLAPAPEADPVTLIRRLHFDLTGLPPTPERTQHFLKAKDYGTAWTDLVDELLASPQFGERLAIYWLDLVRYADTVGYHGDQDHNISPYRDYVIRAFNQNLSFDTFTREQLAGDLIENSGKWQKVASGYNRLLQTSHEGGIQEKEYNTIYAADRVRNLSAVWMGATVGCAQCHDHKYDPYTIKDHYTLAAFFADVHDVGYNGNALPTNRPPEMLFHSDANEEKLREIKEELESLLSPQQISQLREFEKRKLQLEAEARIGKDQKRKNELLSQAKLIASKINEVIPAQKKTEWDRLESERRTVEARGRLTMITEAKPPREMRVLSRGDWQDESGELVTPAIPEFMGTIPHAGEIPTRLDLANWLVDPENGLGGLTARIFANRFWYLFFGTGISRSLEDFGGQGEPPANGRLLDNLSVAFYENDWDIKAFVRLLVTSRAYRQSSVTSAELAELDPYNQLTARQSRYRLPAEIVRDNALAVSGLLVLNVPDIEAARLGGDSVKPYQPIDYYKHLNFPTRKYTQHNDSRQWRRGLYVHWQRLFLHPMMKAMDAPTREECTAERPRSNTPNAALVLLNDPTFIEAARAFAARVLNESDDSFEERLTHAYQLCLSRSPEEDEVQLLRNLFTQTQGEYESNAVAAKELLSLGKSPPPEGVDPVKLASWTAVTRALLNLSETVTRN
ncbi:MAG: hypothetical protein CMO61_09305 [Verrucomicrobiales bacterium]|nr:hypothetical protein [Verrucomicrobiales bacterium]|tara:strand:- start:12578 stop:15088 length:2511 start_codon:yes stop_codon:yes gene_type:complete